MVARRIDIGNSAMAAGFLALCAAIGALAGVEPRLALTASLGLAFALLTFASLAAGVAVLVLVSFMETVSLAGPALSYTKLAGLLLAVSWLARIATDPEARERTLLTEHPAAAYMLALLLAWAALSFGWAEDGGAALRDLSRFALNAALVVIVYTAVRGPREAWWVIGAFIAGVAATSAYGLVLQPEHDPKDVGRLASTIQDPNVLAASLVAGLALSVATFAAWRGRQGIRLASATAATLCVAAFLLTGSRGGIVALAVALVVAVVVAGRRRAQALALALSVLALGAAYYAAYAPPEVRERVVTATPGEQRDMGGRQTIWQVGWRMVERRPITGVGVGNFQAASVHHVLEPGRTPRTDEVIDGAKVAHNTYLHVLAELGIVGLALFLAITGFSLSCTARAARSFAHAGRRRLELLSRGVLVAMGGLLASYIFISEQFSDQFWLLIAMGPALLALSRRSGPDSGAPA